MFSEHGEWSRRNFGGAKLNDRRRRERVIEIGAAMAEHPGDTIPKLFGRPYDVKAAYNLFKHEEATPDNLQAGHRELVLERLSQPGEYLLPEDTTECSWVTHRPIPGLGPVGGGSELAQGFHLHSLLAVQWSNEVLTPEQSRRPPLEVIGLAYQQFYVRKPIPEEERGKDSKPRKKRERESEIWTEAGSRLKAAPPNVRWVRVCDRAADIYEFLMACQELGHGFVVRACQDRALVEPKERLFDQARQMPAMGYFELALRERPKHPARTAKLAVSACPVAIRSPQRPGASPGKLPPVRCWVVHVWEVDAPADVEPLEWFLLTDRPVEDFESALRCALQYATRWVIEDFHKALKTGLGAQKLQLEDAHRLFAAISIMSIVALRLVDLRERVRTMPKAPATEAGFSELELRLLEERLDRDLKTVADVALAIGRLGGHMNRKADGMPGLITLWRGILELQAMVAGATIALRLYRFG
jgi:hypothetical protein